MKKYAIAAAFWFSLLAIQVIIGACACESYYLVYHYVPDRVEVYSTADAQEKDTLGVDWVKRDKEVSGSKVRVGFVANYETREKLLFKNDGFMNSAYAECLPEYHTAGDTILSMDVITITALEGGIDAGQSVLEHVGWTSQRVDSLINDLNFGFFPQSPSMWFELDKKPVNGKLQLKATMTYARRENMEVLTPELDWK